jgi:hypothetical protein
VPLPSRHALGAATPGRIDGRLIGVVVGALVVGSLSAVPAVTAQDDEGDHQDTLLGVQKTLGGSVTG